MEKWKAPEVLPGATAEVDAVVEGDGAQGGTDPQSGAARVAEHGRIEVAGLDPDIARVEETGRSRSHRKAGFSARPLD